MCYRESKRPANGPIGAAIRGIRKHWNLDCQETADILGVGRKCISKAEHTSGEKTAKKYLDMVLSITAIDVAAHARGKRAARQQCDTNDIGRVVALAKEFISAAERLS